MYTTPSLLTFENVKALVLVLTKYVYNIFITIICIFEQ